MWKQRGFFHHRNYIEKGAWKQRGFIDHRNYDEKGMWKGRKFFDQRNYIDKVRGNDVKICRNLVFNVSTYYPRQINVDLR